MKRLTIFKERGFTIIEVMIAIVLLGIVGLAVISGIGTAFRANQVADKHTTATAIAQRQLEAIEQEDYDDINTDGDGIGIYTLISSIPDGYSIWSYQYNAGYDPAVGDLITDLIMSTTSAGPIGISWNRDNSGPTTNDEGLQRIKLVIAQGIDPDINNNQIVLTLETLKYNTVPW